MSGSSKNSPPPPPEAGGYYGGYYYGEGYSGYADAAVTPNRSIRDYLIILRERIWWLVVTAFVVFFGVALYTFNAPKLYRSFSTVQVLREKDEIFQVEDVVNQEILNQEDFNTQIQILESLAIVQRVDERLKGSERRRFVAPYEKGIDASIRGPLTPLEILVGNRRIVPQRLSLVVRIYYTHPDREISALVANLFAEEYIDFNKNKQIEGSMRAVENLRNQARVQLDKIKKIELELADFKEKYGTLSVERSQDIDNQQLISLNERLDQDKRFYDEARTRWMQVQDAMERGTPLWELNFIATMPQVPELLNRLSLDKIQIAELSKKYREKHPRMIAAMERLQKTESELNAAVSAAASAIKNDFDRTRQNFENSEKRLAEKKEELIALDRLRPEYDALLRDLEISREYYNHYYSRLQQATVQASTEGESARIIDRAIVPPEDDPYRPNIPLNLAIGLVAGVGLGLGLVFLLAILDDKVKTAFDIETTIGLPLIGIIPRINRADSLEKARLVLDDLDRQTVEAFRSVHSTLRLAEESKSAKVILTTSTIPSEGKSFVSTNLGLTFASHGERTIIVDGDLRMPNIGKSLNLTNRAGIMQYMAGEDNLDKLIVRDFAPNLDVLVTGGRTKNPTQILSSSRFENLIHELRMRYDKVLIDSPPLAPVSDALNIIPFVDGIIYVIRFNTVKRKTAHVNIRRLRESNIPVFGAILNNISASVVGYYYSHYYDRSYQSYYLDTEDEMHGETEQKPSEKVTT